jgi:hypothetical protein
VSFSGQIASLRTIGVYVLPGETLAVEVTETEEQGDQILKADSGAILDKALGTWSWKAPELSGLYPVSVTRGAPADSITLNVSVMIPYDELEGELLHGHHIGCYPEPLSKMRKASATPKGFIEVTPDNTNTLVSPHFQLEQFLCKQESGYPKYVILDERLMLKFEVHVRGGKARPPAHY